MQRSTLTRSAAALLVGSAAFASVGCQVAPLPEGYSWNIKPTDKSNRGATHRNGLDASRVDTVNASTNQGGRAYNFASALPGTSSSAAGSAQGSRSLAAPSLAPPADAPQDLFASEAVPAADPAAALFGSPAADPAAGYQVVLQPTPVDGRNAGVATHTIERGESLWSIAERRYGSGLKFQDILAANPGINPQKLRVGDRLVLPGLSAEVR